MLNTLLFPSSPRADVIAQLQNIIPECVQATIEEVGEQALQQFFEGYKTNVVVDRLAA